MGESLVRGFLWGLGASTVLMSAFDSSQLERLVGVLFGLLLIGVASVVDGPLSDFLRGTRAAHQRPYVHDFDDEE